MCSLISIGRLPPLPIPPLQHYSFIWGVEADPLNKSSNYFVWPVRSVIHSIKGGVAENGVGLSNVTMTLSGAASATTTTATDGTYSFPNLADGNYTVTPAMNNYNFTPTDRLVPLAGVDATAQDFSAVCIQHTYYHDLDGDTYGNASDAIQSCTQPFGYVTNSDDCDDSIASVNPGAAEVCGNNIDDNCNGQIDEGCFTDFIVSTLTTPWTTLPGQSILLSDTTKNQGTADAGASTTKFYLSADTILDSGDVLLGSRAVPSLASGAISSGTTAVTIPSGTTSGAYYIIRKADADAVVAETNESKGRNEPRNSFVIFNKPNRTYAWISLIWCAKKTFNNKSCPVFSGILWTPR